MVLQYEHVQVEEDSAIMVSTGVVESHSLPLHSFEDLVNSSSFAVRCECGTDVDQGC